MSFEEDNLLDSLNLPPLLRARISQSYKPRTPPPLPNENENEPPSSSSHPSPSPSSFVLYAPTVVLRSEHNPALALACRFANHYHLPLVILAVFLDDSHLLPRPTTTTTTTITKENRVRDTEGNVAFTARRLTFWMQALQHASMTWSRTYGAGIAVRIHGHNGHRTPHHLTLARRARVVVTDEPFVRPHLTYVEAIERVLGSSGSSGRNTTPCYRVDGSTLVPPSSRLRRAYDERGCLIRSCRRGAAGGRGTGLLPAKAWRWNRDTEGERECHLRAAIKEGQFDAPLLDVTLPTDFFLRSSESVANQDGGDGYDNKYCTNPSLLEGLMQAMPSDWQNKETPCPGTRPWTLDELLAVSDVPSWACQWTQTTNTNTNTNTTISPSSRSVSPCHQTHGGLPSARTRWNTFLTTHLSQYDRTRNHITSPHSVSRMSCYLNWGVLSVFRLCHDLTVARSKPTPSSSSKQRTIRAAALDKFEEEVIKWREFSYAHCYANPDTYDQREVLPLWVLRYLEEERIQKSDDCDNNVWNGVGGCLEGSSTTCPTWNAMQSYLETTGELHNNARMTWGKTIVHWLKHSHDGGDILRAMCYLNDRYALDGLAPPSYAGILWCLGWGDKPGRGGGISVKDSSRYRCGPEGFRTARDLVLGSGSVVCQNEQDGDASELGGGEVYHRRCTQKFITDHIVSGAGAVSSSRKRLVRTDDGMENMDGGRTPTKITKVGSSIEKNKKTLKSYFILKQSIN